MEKNRDNTPERKENDQTDQQKEKRSGSGNAANIDSIITGATGAVKSRHTSETLGNTGTNIIYENNEAPGAGGSVGTGQASGQNATGARISTSDSYDHATGSKNTRSEDSAGEEELKPDQHDDELDRDTLGTP